MAAAVPRKPCYPETTSFFMRHSCSRTVFEDSCMKGWQRNNKLLRHNKESMEGLFLEIDSVETSLKFHGHALQWSHNLRKGLDYAESKGISRTKSKERLQWKNHQLFSDIKEGITFKVSVPQQQCHNNIQESASDILRLDKLLHHHFSDYFTQSIFKTNTLSNVKKWKHPPTLKAGRKVSSCSISGETTIYARIYRFFVLKICEKVERLQDVTVTAVCFVIKKSGVTTNSLSDQRKSRGKQIIEGEPVSLNYLICTFLQRRHVTLICSITQHQSLCCGLFLSCYPHVSRSRGRRRTKRRSMEMPFTQLFGQEKQVFEKGNEDALQRI